MKIAVRKILKSQSRPARGGWIEMLGSVPDYDRVRSRPARGGWIEIFKLKPDFGSIMVPPRTGRVD